MRTGRRRLDNRREQRAAAPRTGVTLPCSGRDLLVIEPAGADPVALEAIVGHSADEGVRHAASAVVWPDADNPYDNLGVAVWIEGHRVGWLRHADSPRLFVTLRSLAAAGEACECGALIVAAEPSPEGTPQLAVELMFDLATAEARAATLRAAGRMAPSRPVGRSVAS